MVGYGTEKQDPELKIGGIQHDGYQDCDRGKFRG